MENRQLGTKGSPSLKSMKSKFITSTPVCPSNLTLETFSRDASYTNREKAKKTNVQENTLGNTVIYKSEVLTPCIYYRGLKL